MSMTLLPNSKNDYICCFTKAGILFQGYKIAIYLVVGHVAINYSFLKMNYKYFEISAALRTGCPSTYTSVS